MKPTITAHMIVKNDDRWVWYAVQSVLPYVDQFFITDTGSQDKTTTYIDTIRDPKIIFTKRPVSSPREITRIRNQQLKDTTTDWLWMVDADEFFPPKTATEIVESLTPDLAGVVVRRYDCLGDVFHYQPDEQVGGYHMFDTTAHFSLRLVNCHLPGLIMQGDYPNEGFVDEHHRPIIDYDKSRFYITKHRFLHMTYLKRSSLGGNLKGTVHRQKYKVEWGKLLPKTVTAPLLSLIPPDPQLIPTHRSLTYNIQAALITPIKMIKRRIFK